MISQSTHSVLYTPIRGLRTRSPIKVKIASSKDKDEIQENENINRETKDSRKILRRSRFDNGLQRGNGIDGSDSVNSIIQQMQFKDPQEIKKELISRFKKDNVDVDDEFIEKMIAESIKEKNLVSEYIKDPSITLSKVSQDEINKYIDWIIEDGSNRIESQQKDGYRRKVELREKLDEFMVNEQGDSDPETMTKAFTMAQELSILNSESSLDKLPIFLTHLSKMSNSELQSSVSLDKYAKLYELSTQIVDLNKRDKCIYLCGKLLYGALLRELGPRARPDPINEKFFIESCIRYEDLDHALALFESRKDKDVKDERFWYELGVFIHLSRYSKNVSSDLTRQKKNEGKDEDEINDDLDKAIDLIQDIRNKWGYVHNLVLIDGLKRCCVNGDIESACWFWEEIELNINDLGIVNDIKVPDTKLLDESEKEKVYNYYNRIEPVSYAGLIEIIFSFIGGLNFENGLNILSKVIEIDNNFIYEFVKKFSSQFKYSGRELFLIELENDKLSNENSDKYLPVIRDYLIDEIKPLQKTRCSSFEEAKLVEDINIYLERLNILKGKNLSKINDLEEIIQSGEKLTSFDVKSLLSILLEHKSATSFQLACRIISQMNEHKSNGVNNSILPVANSYAYTEFCKQFLSQSNPRVKEINQFLDMMIQYDIKLDQTLANKIIISFISKKLYTESIKFIETYLFTENPIAIDKIRLGKPGTKNLWTTAFVAYYKSVVAGSLTNELFKERLQSLHSFIKHMMDEQVDDDFTIQEAIGTLLSYGDFQGTICLLQWYGETINQNRGNLLKFELVLAIKTKLEVSITKAEKYLKRNNKNHNNGNHVYQERIVNYRKEFGIYSLHDDMKDKKDVPWQEVAMIIYKYADLFCYKSTYSRDDPFSMILSDAERYRNKEIFQREIEELLAFYGLPKWEPTT